MSDDVHMILSIMQSCTAEY